MTTFGAESIPHDELAIRLDLDDAQLSHQVENLSDKQVLSRLMISFFFRGGRKELGAEFSHKSFREYLFAEQIMEALKEYGLSAPEYLPLRSAEEYWKDYEPLDPRRKLCHRLTEVLGPVWLTVEVSLHLKSLLAWEVSRACAQVADTSRRSDLSLVQWQRVRNGLADAWDWWGIGIHLRPQPGKRSGHWQYEHGEKPLALQVVENKGSPCTGVAS